MEKEESKLYRCCPYMQQSMGYTSEINDECSVNQYPVDPGYEYPSFCGCGHHGSHRNGESQV